MTISNRQVPTLVLIKLFAKAFMTADKLHALYANGTENLLTASASCISRWISPVNWVVVNIGVVI